MIAPVRLRDLEPDRRRVLDIGTRSKALLELGADKIEKMKDRPPPRPDDLERAAKYERFHRSICIVRLMAEGRAVYDESTRLGPVRVTDDPRLTAISDLAELAAVTAEKLDARTRELAQDEDRGLELCEELMATLPSPCRRYEPPRADRSPRTRSERASVLAVVLDREAASTWALIAAIPDRCSHTDRREWEESLLVDTEAESSVVELENARVPEAAILKAAAAVCRRLRNRRGEGERAKAKRLEQARAKIRRSDDEGVILASRELDLHAELVEPISAELAHVEGLVIRAAVRVAQMSTWPGHGSRVVRALRLAATVSPNDDDLAQAFSTIGYPQIG